MAKLSLGTLQRLVVVVAAAIFAVILYRWISQERLQYFAPREIPASPTPEPTSTRPPPIAGKLDTGRLFNGITLHSTVETRPGADASTERVDPESYVLDLKLIARVPAPNQTLQELAKITPRLPELLPGLAAMAGPDSVSPLFAELYNTKIRMLRENLVRLDLLLSRHNFYDCQTVLQLQHAQSHRKALLLQADMDVDADGSDGDRMPIGTGAPTNFKPFTSFKWAKKTPAPNPYLAGTEERLKRAEDEYALATTSPARKRELRNAIAELRAEVGTLKKFSFLIGATDPTTIIKTGIYDRRPVKTWSKGCCTLLGDAAHPTTPNMGQGGCMAIEDAVVLARCLSNYSNAAMAFRVYERLRYARTARITTLSRYYGVIGQWENPGAVWFRNTLFRLGSGKAATKGYIKFVSYDPYELSLKHEISRLRPFAMTAPRGPRTSLAHREGGGATSNSPVQ